MAYITAVGSAECLAESRDKHKQLLGQIKTDATEWGASITAAAVPMDSKCYGMMIETGKDETTKKQKIKSDGGTNDTAIAGAMGGVTSDTAGATVKEYYTTDAAKCAQLNKVKAEWDLKKKNGVLDGTIKAMSGSVTGSTARAKAAAIISACPSGSVRGVFAREYIHAEAFSDTSACTNSMDEKADMHARLSQAARQDLFNQMTTNEKDALYSYLLSAIQSEWQGWGYGGGPE